MPYLRIPFIALILLCFEFAGYSQSSSTDVIKLLNPGFNGIPEAGKKMISGWRDCGYRRFPGQSPVDLQPGAFDVSLEPFEGQSYLGMVSRDNDTWESVTQELRKPLRKGQCYTFSLYLAASPEYRSDARPDGIAVEEARASGIELKSIHHVTPIVLRIFGSNNQCDPTELLAVSDKVSNHEWKKYDFRFEPNQDLNFIMLEAFTGKVPTPWPANGHILIDDLSAIVAIPCNMEPPVVNFVKPKRSADTKEESYTITAKLKNIFKEDDIVFMLNDKKFTDYKFNMSTGELTAKVPLREGANKLDIKGQNGEGVSQATTVIRQKKDQEVVAVVPPKRNEETNPQVSTVPADNTLEGVKREDLKKDLKLVLKNITFDMDSSSIKKENERSLLKIGDFLKQYRDVIIEIGGHTNDRCDEPYCNSLSEERAKAVLNFLVQNGVTENQLSAKGYGRHEPIASNNSTYGRRKNQRVEIKILDAGS